MKTPKPIPLTVQHARKLGYKQKEMDLTKLSSKAKQRWTFVHKKSVKPGHVGAIKARDASGGRWVCYTDPTTQLPTDCHYVE